ncbi:class I SAM-dependent DNA methyltransferase [Qipengyuania gelatinilytica]|uniref:site-specific DNA-methyltransferase (adenine-specific) n=1 Tax=Qipengyuania gelatinilytica TaxID=2867231 RepID=A0ABX9A7C5_9SPHN|nr:DNA methyltransferase [Qipengyuania gelatinilytica]QZD96214.1 class I SAM-dependent DNA methyltransferase [Qipengyuania gelatinilytica]
MGEIDQTKIADLIDEAKASGGSEMANAQLFIERLTVALGLPSPKLQKEDTATSDYVFERPVTFRHTGGSTSTGRIDCYKRDCFILEAKQSAKRKKARESEQLELAGIETSLKLGHAKRGTKTWDKVMIAAKKQAEDYARSLPDDHAYPPFLLIADIGNVIEVYADFSGQGRNYAHFPDRQTYRLSMDDLLEDEVQKRLRAIWTEPHALDPARISAEVTEDIATRLAKIAKSLERKYDPKDIAEFLMRCLFTMFAEDIGLIEETEEEKRAGVGPFEAMLERMVETPDYFPQALESLWATMDAGGYAGEFGRPLKRFNGSLFKKRTALKLEADDIRELWLAARKDWQEVEPAIFGTLLERALASKERGKLGAHFTPRVYVERLVVPTIIEPLREDWDEVQALVADLRRAGKNEAAIEAVRQFHHQLCTTRVLDPACGTGNFLYVSLELMKRLEGEVLDALESLGDDEARLLLDGETVNPRQFYGLEINPRAVPIADLVLWIGFLKWQLRTTEAKNLPEPILHAYGTIKEQDALLAYDSMEMLRDDKGKPLSRWDGETMKLHPITGEEIPDPDATMELYQYVNPRRADWPEVEFIVGNPPFIGGKDMRAELGDGYAEAAWKVRKDVPGGADFVMHFWDEAATRLLAKPPKGAKGENPLRRFGFITTNSITQTFSRRVVERHMNAKLPLSLVYAIPDHPWLKASDKAAVRIAMTVAVRGERQGKLAEVVHESGLNTDTPEVRLEVDEGKVTSGLKLGASFSKVIPLAANELLSAMGVKLHGAGFILTERSARRLGLNRQSQQKAVIFRYRNGRDLAQHSRDAYLIDVTGISLQTLGSEFPDIYQHLLENVKPERDQNRDRDIRERWTEFGRTRPEMREFLVGLPRYAVTIETAKHHFFQFLAADIRPDNMLVALGLEGADLLAVLSSRAHILWMLGSGGTLEDRPRYNKTQCFDPFPFPILTDAQSAKLDQLGERLDAFRKERLAEHDFLTMTDIYNVLERLRELEQGVGEPLSQKERDIHEAGLISVLKDIHDDIDREVFAAYGWEDLGERLVGRPGATTPSPHKTEGQEAAEEELLTRLVALNQERAAEEKRGLIRWLRPEYQRPRLAHKVKGQDDLDMGLVEAGVVEERAWPKDGLEQIRALRDVLSEAEAPLLADALATLFKGRTTSKRRQRVEEVLETLVETGAARDSEEGYFLPR